MIHIYSGYGKGKTTAAVGLSVRGAGAGLRVMFCQFMKNGTSSEIAVLEQIPGITVRFCPECSKFSFRMDDSEKQAARMAQDALIAEIRCAVHEHSADLIVMDEIISGCNTGLADREAVLGIMRNCPEDTELILTGRDPDDEIASLADYHSSITELRHPYKKGIGARRGIEY
ncbi:MAG TPA: ATP--corrinoid adenosyltransferase BtuR/CobO/CobP [Ruminococcus sp.]|nr:ATP--corrinoid adenosyltransferase BtuR/CobO/CobP [Ruminococcus sp.]